MNQTWQDRLWYLGWYFLIPGALAFATVRGLAAAGVTEDEPWKYLLAFAVLEVVVLGIRDRIYGAKGAGGVADIRAVRAEAIEIDKEAARLTQKHKLPEAKQAEVDAARKNLKDAVEARDAARASKAVRALDSALERNYGEQRKGTTREYVEAIGLAVLVALGIRAFVVEAFKIPSPSMYPTLYEGDNIFVNKLSFGPLLPFTNRRLFDGGLPNRGDVVVFIFPNDPSKDYIKRVVGLPGDRVQVREDGTVEINGTALPRCEVGAWRGDDGDRNSADEPERRLFLEWAGQRRYLVLQSREASSWRGTTYCTQTPCTVPPNSLFVMGDNRDNSQDSRFWGFVPMQNVKGRAMRIWWSNPPGGGCGLRYERFGQDILGDPHVPAELQTPFNACMRRAGGR